MTVLSLPLFLREIENFQLLIPLMLGGAIIGAVLAKRVEMTSMPELVAILHSFVGLAAVLVGMASFLDPSHDLLEGANRLIHDIGILLTFYRRNYIYGVSGRIQETSRVSGGKPLLLPGNHFINLGMLLVSIWLGSEFLIQGKDEAWVTLLIVTGISLVLGVHLIVAIGELICQSWFQCSIVIQAGRPLRLGLCSRMICL